MSVSLRFAALLTLSLLLIESAQAQQPAQATPAAVQFHRALPKEGESAQQHVTFEARMNVTVSQQQQLIDRQSTHELRRQRRTVRLTEVVDGKAVAAEVRFDRAEKTSGSGNQSARKQTLPVQSKTYHIRRNGEKLLVHDEDGAIPPLEEFEIVHSAMESFGKQNPLVDYLAGKTIRVGQTLQLPRRAAKTLLAMGDTPTDVQKFDLTLKGTHQHGPERHAVFDVDMMARSLGTSQTGMHIQGNLAVDPTTCRVAHLDLTGPIGFTESKTSALNNYLITGAGKLRIAMRRQ